MSYNCTWHGSGSIAHAGKARGRGFESHLMLGFYSLNLPEQGSHIGSTTLQISLEKWILIYAAWGGTSLISTIWVLSMQYQIEPTMEP